MPATRTACCTPTPHAHGRVFNRHHYLHDSPGGVDISMGGSSTGEGEGEAAVVGSRPGTQGGVASACHRTAHARPGTAWTEAFTRYYSSVLDSSSFPMGGRVIGKDLLRRRGTGQRSGSPHRELQKLFFHYTTLLQQPALAIPEDFTCAWLVQAFGTGRGASRVTPVSAHRCVPEPLTGAHQESGKFSTSINF